MNGLVWLTGLGGGGRETGLTSSFKGSGFGIVGDEDLEIMAVQVQQAPEVGISVGGTWG